MRLSLFLIAGLIAISPVSASVLTNGSFEGCPAGNSILPGGSAAVSGWTTANEGVEWFRPADYGLSQMAGTCSVDLAWYISNGTPGGAIEQTVATTIGQTYLLTFLGATSTFSGRTGTGIIDLHITGNPVVNFNLSNNTADIVSQSFSHTFVATAASTTIRFANTQNAVQHFAMVDNVVLDPVPEPATCFLVGGALLALGAFRRHRA